MMNFSLFNGQIIKNEELKLPPAILEAPLFLSQKIWFGVGGIPLFYENLALIDRLVKSLHLPSPAEMANKRELYRLTKRMLNKNRFYRSGLLNFILFSSQDRSDTLISGTLFPGTEFPFSKSGLLVNFSDQIKFSGNRYNRYSFYNKNFWEAILRELNNTIFQNSIILNEKNMICECAYSNIYMLKGRKMITPSILSGCYEDMLRSLVLKAADCLGIEVVESKTIHKNDLMQMDEIFIAGEQTGIKWILGIENKRFLHFHSLKLHEKINELLKNKVS